MTENEISYKIRGAIFEVYNHFGSGLFESVYKQSLFICLHDKNMLVKKEVPVAASFNGQDLGLGFRIDLLVENKVVIEVKSIEALADIHRKQLLTYLKLTGLKLGILVNFNTTDLTKSIIRVVNNL